MPEWITKGERVHRKRFYRQFDWPGEPNCGFAFPCDEQGNLMDEDGKPINPAAYTNYEACLTGTVDGRPIIDVGITVSEWSFWEPGTLRCQRCKGEVVIDMLMTNTCPNCISCGQPERFSWHEMTAEECEAWMRVHTNGERGCDRASEHHVFEGCEADYSSSGQLLAPRSQWGWDTGESLGDILAADGPLT